MSEFETTIDGALERITRLLETLAARMATAERQLQTVIDVLPEMQREIEVLPSSEPRRRASPARF